MNEKVIDVSEFNGFIDWKKVKKAGIDKAIIRIGGRYATSGKLYYDDRAVYNIEGAIENGIKIGLYFFTQAISKAEAIEEANYILSRVNSSIMKGKIDLPIFIDTEYYKNGRHNNLLPKDRTNIVIAFMETIIKAGFDSGVYASVSWFYDELDVDRLRKYKLWVAQYNSECEFTYPYYMWQYTSSGGVDGINGNVDLNILMEYKEEYSDKVKIMAVDTILGFYGNNEERVKALGSYYNSVQDLVNELCRRLET